MRKWIFLLSVQFSYTVLSNFLWLHGLKHVRLPCPSLTPRAYSNSCPLHQWCHPTISSSVVSFSSRLQSFPASSSSHQVAKVLEFQLQYQSFQWIFRTNFLWSMSALSQLSRSVVSSSLPSHGPQHARLPCPSLTPGICSNSYPLSQWCHPTISSSVVPFSSCLQSFSESGSFPMSRFFASGGQSTGVSASVSVLPMNIQGWFPPGLTGLISLLSKSLSRVFSSTTVQKHQFFGAQFSSWSNSHIHTWL